ncbi:MAG: inositol monophosphatase family protein [Cyanobacteria bacterium]|nr:inositol monophosphatase family protein [Cyanobacteriota bacterium]MDW8201925.1 inositol monophosphatase family protein [Cyanobacteriota bacterium SKYGB_h_bin112]
MTLTPTPWGILETLFPYLRVAAAYANHIQSRIVARPAKDGYDNFFGAALSDADLSIQTMVEVALLGTFPDIRFYGEEHEQSYNTKYFRAIDLGEKDDYLVTLDPIDGTQSYLDGHSNYQIILTVLNRDEFEAAIAITPAQGTYYYALRGKGCWQGTLDDGLESAQPLRVGTIGNTVLLGWGMEALALTLQEHYHVIDIATSYSTMVQIPNVNGMLSGELAGAVIRAGKFIDGAAIAFLAEEAGAIVTTLTGEPPPPLYTCQNYERPGLVIAASPTVHEHLLAAARQVIP